LSARIASNTDDGDRSAGDTDEDINALDNNAQKTEEESSNGVLY